MTTRNLIAIGLLTLLAAPALAQLNSDSRRGAQERVALARARREVAAQVGALPSGRPDLALGAWFAQHPSRDRAALLWARTLSRSGDTRFFSGGECEVDIRVTPAELLAAMRAIRDQTGADPQFDFSDAAGAWPVIWATGVAVSREPQKGAAASGWEDVAGEGAQLARLAATADAAAALLEAAGRLRVSAARRLHEFLDSDVQIRDSVTAAIREKAQMRVELGADQLAEAQARLPLLELIRILTDAHQRHYAGDLFHAADFREMALLNDMRELRATGLAPPPERYILRPEFEALELDEPEWAGATFTASGAFETPADGAELSPAALAEAARLMAMNALREQIERLVVQRDVTVEYLLEFHPELKDDVIVFLGGARASGTPRQSPERTEVDVELPLRRLWRILRRAMPVIEAPASQPVVESNVDRDAESPASRESEEAPRVDDETSASESHSAEESPE